MQNYKNVNGTSYDIRTPEDVARVLENARLHRTRLHISLGDPETGLDWLEEFDTCGYVGRSMGPIKVPLLLANRLSTGGGAILDHCVVRIRRSAGGQVLYWHPSYHHGDLEIRRKTAPLVQPDGRILTVNILRNGRIHAAFENTEQARKWVSKLGVRAPIAK